MNIWPEVHLLVEILLEKLPRWVKITFMLVLGHGLEAAFHCVAKLSQ